MTVQEKKRRRIKRKAKRCAAWALLYLFELTVAAVPAAILGAVIIPVAEAQRGYEAMGSEWLLVGIVFWLAFATVHRRVCRKIFEEAGR